MSLFPLPARNEKGRHKGVLILYSPGLLCIMGTGDSEEEHPFVMHYNGMHMDISMIMG